MLCWMFISQNAYERYNNQLWACVPAGTDLCPQLSPELIYWEKNTENTDDEKYVVAFILKKKHVFIDP